MDDIKTLAAEFNGIIATADESGSHVTVTMNGHTYRLFVSTEYPEDALRIARALNFAAGIHHRL